LEAASKPNDVLKAVNTHARKIKTHEFGFVLQRVMQLEKQAQKHGSSQTQLELSRETQKVFDEAARRLPGLLRHDATGGASARQHAKARFSALASVIDAFHASGNPQEQILKLSANAAAACLQAGHPASVSRAAAGLATHGFLQGRFLTALAKRIRTETTAKSGKRGGPKLDGFNLLVTQNAAITALEKGGLSGSEETSAWSIIRSVDAVLPERLGQTASNPSRTASNAVSAVDSARRASLLDAQSRSSAKSSTPAAAAAAAASEPASLSSVAGESAFFTESCVLQSQAIRDAIASGDGRANATFLSRARRTLAERDVAVATDLPPLDITPAPDAGTGDAGAGGAPEAAAKSGSELFLFQRQLKARLQEAATETELIAVWRKYRAEFDAFSYAIAGARLVSLIADSGAGMRSRLGSDVTDARGHVSADALDEFVQGAAEQTLAQTAAPVDEQAAIDALDAPVAESERLLLLEEAEAAKGASSEASDPLALKPSRRVAPRVWKGQGDGSGSPDWLRKLVASHSKRLHPGLVANLTWSIGKLSGSVEAVRALEWMSVRKGSRRSVPAQLQAKRNKVRDALAVLATQARGPVLNDTMSELNVARFTAGLDAGAGGRSVAHLTHVADALATRIERGAALFDDWQLVTTCFAADRLHCDLGVLGTAELMNRVRLLLSDCAPAVLSEEAPAAGSAAGARTRRADSGAPKPASVPLSTHRLCVFGIYTLFRNPAAAALLGRDQRVVPYISSRTVDFMLHPSFGEAMRLLAARADATERSATAMRQLQQSKSFRGVSAELEAAPRPMDMRVVLNAAEALQGLINAIQLTAGSREIGVGESMSTLDSAIGLAARDTPALRARNAAAREVSDKSGMHSMVRAALPVIQEASTWSGYSPHREAKLGALSPTEEKEALEAVNALFGYAMDAIDAAEGRAEFEQELHRLASQGQKLNARQRMQREDVRKVAPLSLDFASHLVFNAGRLPMSADMRYQIVFRLKPFLLKELERRPKVLSDAPLHRFDERDVPRLISGLVQCGIDDVELSTAVFKEYARQTWLRDGEMKERLARQKKEEAAREEETRIKQKEKLAEIAEATAEAVANEMEMDSALGYRDQRVTNTRTEFEVDDDRRAPHTMAHLLVLGASMRLTSPPARVLEDAIKAAEAMLARAEFQRRSKNDADIAAGILIMLVNDLGLTSSPAALKLIPFLRVSTGLLSADRTAKVQAAVKKVIEARASAESRDERA
jgi:hypothetical protein